MARTVIGLVAAIGLGSWTAPAVGQPAQGRFMQFPEETLLCTVEVPRKVRPEMPVGTLDDVCAALAACWKVPEGLDAKAGLEVTIRFALGEYGLSIGGPRHTYAAGVGNAEARAILVRESIAAIRRCTPVERTPTIKATMAPSRGDIALRLIYKPPNR